MGYIGQAPANKVVTSADIEDGVVSAADLGANSVDSSELVDGSIDTSHIGATQVTGAKLNNDVISAQTALGATPADTDELLVSDAGVLKRVDYSHLKSTAVTRPNANPLWINGNMAIAQRSTSATGKTASGYYACDRMHLNISSLGTWTIAQETLTSGNAYADGFQKALRFDCTTADASPSANDHCFVRQKFEGQDVQAFKKGTANAETYTLAFWVKSNKTGTDIFTCGLYDHDNTRSVFQNYTISSADTWEYKVLNFPKDTTGVMDNNNAVSIDVRWYLGAGSNFTGGTQATSAWEAQTTANNLPSGKVNLADSTSNDIAITGVQLEVGTYTSSDLPPFRHESYGENLARCQRYLTRFDSTGASGEIENVFANIIFSSGGFQAMIFYPQTMRTAPSLTSSAVDTFNAHMAGVLTQQVTALAGANMSTFGARITGSCTYTGTDGLAGQLTADGTDAAHIQFDAEL